MTWEAVVAKAQTSSSFADELHAARRMLLRIEKGEAADRPFLPQVFGNSEGLQISLERAFLFLPKNQFKGTFGIDPEKLPSLPIDRVKDESGRMVEGYVFADPNLGPFRALKVAWTAGSSLDTNIMNDKMLRPEQGRDLQSWFTEKCLQECPKPLRPGAENFMPLEMEAVKKLADEASASGQEKGCEQPKAAPAAPLESRVVAAENEAKASAAGDAAGNNDDDDDADDDDDDECETDIPPEALLASVFGSQKGGEASRRSKGGSKNGRGGKTLSEGVKKRGQDALEKESGAASCSGVTSRRRKSGKQAEDRERSRSRDTRVTRVSVGDGSSSGGGGVSEKLSTSTAKTVSGLELEKILDGCKVGVEVNTAKRQLTAWENKSPGCSDHVMLQAKLTLAQSAQTVNAGNLAKLPKAVRNERIENLAPHLRSTPVKWARSLLVATVREMSEDILADTEKVETWVARINPSSKVDKGLLP